MTSNCAGQPAGCTVNSTTGFDVASFMLGLRQHQDPQPVRRRTPTRRTRPEYSLYVQDDFRATSRLTLNLGLRWDVYPPWIEVDDRQSNFDETTGKFVVASDDAVINGVKVGRYLQTYSKRDFGPRFGFAYDLTGNGKTLVRGGFGVFWNFTPGGTSSSKAQNPPFLQATALNADSDGLRRQPAAQGRVCRRLPESIPTRPAAGPTRSIFDINFRDAYARQWNVNVQRSLATNYMVEIAYVGSQGRQMLLKGDPNQAPPVVGVTDSNVNRPYAQALAGAAHDRPGPEQGHARLQRAARQVPASLRQQLLVPELLHLREGDRPELRQRRSRHADQRLRSAATTAGRPTTTSRTRSRRAGSTSCRWARDKVVRRLAVQRHHAAARRPAADGHARPRACSPPARATVRTGSATASSRTRPSTSGSTPAASRRRPTTRAPTATPAAASSAGPARSTSTRR